MSDGLAAVAEFCSTSLDDHFEAHARIDAAARALALFRRAAERVPAYRAFLAAHGLDATSELSRAPVITKDGYLRRHALPDLCFDGMIGGCDTVAVSSGSTGVPTYFPRGLRHEAEVAWRFEQVLRESFDAHRRPTLAIVCFPLGTWVGGMFTAACCRLLAQKGYPLMVVTPGNQPPEILRAVRELGGHYEQIVLLGYPPFLKDVVDGGAASGIDWARVPVKLVLAGEVVSEAWRDIMMERTGATDALHHSASLYGTADAGVLGCETPLCVAIRRFCAGRPEVAESVFGARRLPTLVQYDPVDRFFEQDGEALVFTGEGGGIPLVRYAIGDRGGVLTFQEMRERLADSGLELPGARPLPFVYVFGRTEHAVSFYGANVFAEVVRLGLEHDEVRAHVTGKFVMATPEDAGGDRHLVLDVELARGTRPDDVLAGRVGREVRAALLAASGEFGAYVPPGRQLPEIRLWEHGHATHFPIGVKHRYVRG